MDAARNADHLSVVGRDRTLQPVAPRHLAVAASIDANRDGVCEDAEILQHLRERSFYEEGGHHGNVDEARMLRDFKTNLQGKPLPQAAAYHTYEEVTLELQQLAEQHPDIAKLESLGKSVEGRDIWALKITKDAQADTADKPAVVFNGLHHSREWCSMEVPMHLAHSLIDGYGTDAAATRRVDAAETWIIPLVNPDGYEYSRTEDAWWRKNRQPIFEDGASCPAGAAPVAQRDDEPVAMGVDLNRNYWDGDPEHLQYYRDPSDKPCDSSDDMGASDEPWADDYRGRTGGSEPEVQAMMKLEYERPNIKGIIDHHSYGEALLRPWGYTDEPPADINEYDEIAARMQAAQSQPYEYIASSALYPTYGSSENSHQARGIKNFTIELGQSFQPDPEEIEPICQNVAAADFAFLDWIIEKHAAVSARA